MVMQVLVLAVQNAVEFSLPWAWRLRRDAVQVDRGGSVGVAMFGAIFSNGPAHAPRSRDPPGARIAAAVARAASHPASARRAPRRLDLMRSPASMHTVYPPVAAGMVPDDRVRACMVHEGSAAAPALRGMSRRHERAALPTMSAPSGSAGRSGVQPTAARDARFQLAPASR